MRFSCKRSEFQNVSALALRKLIGERRNAIRDHRDALGDDRCWFDDWLIWPFLSDTPEKPTGLFPEGEAMMRCTAFYEWRREEFPDGFYLGTASDRVHWDDDLQSMEQSQLIFEFGRVQDAIRMHRDAAKVRLLTPADDRRLYAVLPEKVPADFRLPSRDDFLGEAKAPHAGCPAFWRSHRACLTNQHNFHQQGPCPARQLT